MFGMSTLLGKRPPRSHPMGSPTASGSLPDAQDIPGPPSAKIAAQTDVQEELNSLRDALHVLSSRVELVPDLQRQVIRLEQEAAEGRQVRVLLEKELAADKASLSRSEERASRLEKRLEALEKASEKGKHPMSYAVAAGRDEADKLRRDQEEVSHKVVQLEQAAERQDRQSRAQNVMLFGLSDDGRDSPLQQVTACLQAAGITECNKVQSAFRLGGKRPASPAAANASRPGPIKVVMQSAADAAALLRHTRALRQRQRVNLDRDITPQQAHLRRNRQGAAKELRDMGFVTFWRGDQLVYVDKATGRREVYTGHLPRRA